MIYQHNHFIFIHFALSEGVCISRPISEMSKCLYPHHLSVCCRCCCCWLSLSLWLGLTLAASQHNENAINFFQQFLFAPPSHGRQRLQLWLQLWLWSRCCCNIMTPAVCPDSRPGRAATGARAKKKLMFIVKHFLWRQHNDCSASLLGLAHRYISPGMLHEPFALNEETNYSRL